MDDLARIDAVGQAELVRKGRVSSRELVEAAIERIERANPKLNCVVTPLYEQARENAAGELPRGPFRGVPFLLKDLLASYAGVPMTEGSRLLSGFVPEQDSELVRRLKASGLVIVGKTNTPEFGILGTTEPEFLGPTRNPWDPERSAGGSSGGSAAAVAAGLVPMAHANDGGGSIRIPASCCGVFGLKPTRARNPLGPRHGDLSSGLIVEHAVTRSVRDSAALLDATAGPDLGDPYRAPPPDESYLSQVGKEPGQLRVAFSVDPPMMRSIAHQDCVAAVKDAAALCEELGHHVEEARPPLDPEQLGDAFDVVWTGGISTAIEGWSRRLGRSVTRDDVEALTWAVDEHGRAWKATDYLLAIAELQRASRAIAVWHQSYDLWLTPTVSSPPPPLGRFDSIPEDPLRGYERDAEFCPFTPVQNFSGQPAMSVPLWWNESELPVGVQFAARFGDESTLFRLAGQLEQARPWAERRPPISGVL
jgi:amidase